MNFQMDEKLINDARIKLDSAVNSMKKITSLSNELKNYPPEYEYISNVESVLNQLPSIFNRINEVVVKLGGLKIDFSNPFNISNFKILNDNEDRVSNELTNYFYELHSRRNNLTKEEQEIYNAIKNTLRTNLVNNKNVNYNYKKYDLTDDEIKQIASLCMQEQGSVEGAKAEASLMANLYEQNKKEGKATDIYSYVRNSGWFANSQTFMDKRNAPEEVNKAVESVLVDGNRTLPPYINEHDCLSDIESISNNNVVVNKNNRNNYIKNVSKVNQSTSSFGENAGKWTYYTHPEANSDPFGYTDKSVDQILDEMIENHEIKY